MPGWVLLLAPDGHALYASPALAALSGRSAAQLLGTAWQGLMSAASVDALLVRLRRPVDSELRLELLDRAGHPTPARCIAHWLGDGERCACILQPTAGADADAEPHA